MGFKFIIKTWTNSLTIFLRKELLLFLFSWFCTFKRSLLTFIKYFWWLIILPLIFYYTRIYISSPPSLMPGTISLITVSISFIYVLILNFFMILSIRPSIEIKETSYFAKYLKKFFGVFIILLILNTLLYIVTYKAIEISLTLTTIIIGLNFFLRTTLLPTTILFFFDKHKNEITSIWKSIKQGCLSVFLYLPAFLILFVFYLPLNILVANFYATSPQNFTFFQFTSSYLCMLLIQFIFLCFVSILYLKIKHSNYKLFSNKN